MKYDDLWSLQFEDIEILGTVMIEVSDAEALEGFISYDIVEDEDSDEGEFDFL